MALYLYYILLGIYGILLAVSLFYYLSRKTPGGDASVDWAIGIFHSLGLGLIVLVALILQKKPLAGVIVLCLPLVFWGLPALRRVWTDLYAWLPVQQAPPLVLVIENDKDQSFHIQVECWFGAANSDTSTLYKVLDYYVLPKQRGQFQLNAYETRLLAYKSRFVRFQIFEQVTEENEGRIYVLDEQPCMRFFDEKPEVFLEGRYTVSIDEKTMSNMGSTNF